MRWNLDWVVIIILCVMLACAFLYYDHHSIKESIRFLDKAESAAVFADIKQFSYLENYRFLESKLKTSGYVTDRDEFKLKVTQAYAQNVMDFSSQEKTAISTLIDRYPKLRQRRWNLIKMNEKMDMGLPYTISDHIVMPTSLIIRIVNQDNRAAETLAHEQIHIMQRQNQQRFDEFYQRHWNFTKIPNLIIADNIRERLITNPDSPFLSWVLNCHGKLWWFCLLVDSDMKMTKRAFEVRRLHAEVPVYEIKGEGKDLAEFASIFWGLTEIHSPNEIFAYRFAHRLLT